MIRDVALDTAVDYEFQPIGEDGYLYRLPQIQTEFLISRIRRDRYELHCELVVKCGLVGIRAADGILSSGSFNVSSLRARKERAQHLHERARLKDGPDWLTLVEQSCHLVIEADRRGEPSIDLADAEDEPEDAHIEIAGLPLLEHMPNLVFGDGDSLKSFLAVFLAGEMARRGRTVGYVDAEFTASAHKKRLARIYGDRVPRGIRHVRVNRPLVYETDRLSKLAREDGWGFAFFDSVSFLADGPPEAAEVAIRYSQAVRSLGEIGTLHVAHMTKAFEGADMKPFGSAFWFNWARAVWNAKKTESQQGEAHLALYCRKANLGRLKGSCGFRFEFDAQRVAISPMDVATNPELAEGLPVWERMSTALSSGAMTKEKLADAIVSKPDTVRRTAQRYPARFVLLPGGMIGLKAAI